MTTVLNPIPARDPSPIAAAWPMAAGGAWAEQVRQVLESTGEGIFGVDTLGHCTFVNRAAAEMLGHRTDAVLGRNMHALIHHTHADGSPCAEADCPIFNAFRQGLPCRIDSEVLWRADGSAFSAECSSHPILDGGVVQGAVVTFADITERKRSEALLQQSREQLESRAVALAHERTAELTQALGALRGLSAHSESVREDERTRIAREIHDELGSLLVALKMDVGWLEKRVQDRPELTGKCHGMGRTIDTAVDNLGRIITDLRPSILDHQGLWAALEWQAQEFIETTELASDLQMHVAAQTDPPRGPGGDRWAIAVVRIFQAMLSNVARHAHARSVRIRLYVDGPPQPVLHIEVRDDGIGAESSALNHPRSHGVMGMRERAGHFGGTLAIDSVPNHGTCVRLTMPMPQHVEDGPSAGSPQAGPRQSRDAAGTSAVQARAGGLGAAACVPLGGSANAPVRRGAP